MAVNPKDIDPAIVSSAADKPKQAPPKREIPVSTKVLTAKASEEADAAPKFDCDMAANCLVATTDSKVLAMPRALAAKVPVVGVILADQPADDHSPIPIGTSANAAIAIAHWVEHVGSASGKAESPVPEEIVYTDMTSFLLTDWEKDFDTRILTAESETLLHVINFAEQNGMIGLLDFCVAALSCALRGKSNHEMMVAMCVDGEEMSAEEIQAGKEAFPWINDITKPHDE
eukprot:CAMPEP_0174849996 /NCGR_PEP_ID=MMETSP1114-20130205/18581_1 /TAXON_ID=312471 /ORGANISM="Neobodo designis, Strain CCAP 1951/1" /LENGTH=229 /DNA_ID=CAMNT_0016084417 /DNA_START=157 /DNA_END=846 /DNA_ORIENTATION=+